MYNGKGAAYIKQFSGVICRSLKEIILASASADASADTSEDLSLDILMMPLERLRTVYTVAEQSIVI